MKTYKRDIYNSAYQGRAGSVKKPYKILIYVQAYVYIVTCYIQQTSVI